MPERRLVSWIAASCVMLVVLVAGCSSDRSDFPNRIQPDIHADGTKVLRKGNGSEPGTLDPHQASGVPAAGILQDLYEGLVITGHKGGILPADAKTWEISADRKTYTFHLRDNARWSNGAPVTAGDYVFSFRRMVDPKTASPYADIHAPIVNATAIINGDKTPATLGVKALDKHTLQIRLDKPTPFFLQTLAHVSSDPVYPPAVKKWGDAFTQPAHSVSNGAYQLKQWRVNDKIVLVRNRQYWDNAHTRIDQVEYYPIDNSKSELSRYQAGGLDWTYSVPAADLDAIKANIPKQLHTVPTLGIAYFGMNVTRAPFKDNRKLRLALSMALNRQVIVDKILRGGQIPAYSWIPTAVQGYDSVRYQWADWSDKRRDAMARKLYQEAGYSDQHPLKAEFLYPTGGIGKTLSLVAAAMWRKVLGVEITPRNEEWKVFLQTTRNQFDTQIFWGGWIGDYEDPNTFFSILNSHAALNYTGYHSAVYDKAQAASEHVPNGPQRTALMHTAEAALLHDAPLMPIFFWTNHHLIKPYVKGFVPNPLDNYYSKDLDIVPAGTASQTSPPPANDKQENH
ncbi:MAG: peptide ABC transporter substrate-binding protein [Salinisphaera sp.]|jgi:oligopeptide transport system substrate-binding protein|nr:peptide ABC transporter substrate-binding protein [Salinisphaera sp.]